MENISVNDIILFKTQYAWSSSFNGYQGLWNNRDGIYCMRLGTTIGIVSNIDIHNIEKNNVYFYDCKLCTLLEKPIADNIKYRKHNNINSRTFIPYLQDEFIENKTIKFKREIAATIIQKTWRKCISSPYYKICKKRLLKEWNEMNNN